MALYKFSPDDVVRFSSEQRIQRRLGTWKVMELENAQRGDMN